MCPWQDHPRCRSNQLYGDCPSDMTILAGGSVDQHRSREPLQNRSHPQMTSPRLLVSVRDMPIDGCDQIADILQICHLTGAELQPRERPFDCDKKLDIRKRIPFLYVLRRRLGGENNIFVVKHLLKHGRYAIPYLFLGQENSSFTSMKTGSG